MFVWAKLPPGFADDRRFVHDLLRASGLLVTPGSAFGPSGQGHVRMALVQENEAVQRALEALRQSGFCQAPPVDFLACPQKKSGAARRLSVLFAL